LVGIQVKTVQHVNNGRAVQTLDIGWNGRGKSYYAANGVQAFAVWTGRGFYVIPLNEVYGEHRVRVQNKPWLWEAWQTVIGEPASVVHAGRSAEHQGELFGA
jgi:hypothetical protein